MKHFPKINKVKIVYFVTLVIVFAAFSFLALLNIELKKQNSLIGTYTNPINFTPARYPQVNFSLAPVISAQGAVVIDKDSQVVLFEKNPNIRFSPASTTKIMTSLVALEYYEPSDILTIYKSNVEGTTLRFPLNEQFTFEDLLYAMMLPSSNDATQAIAENYPGGEKAFVARMNEKAKAYHLTDTYFEEPIGLLDEKDYTTAIDLARLTSIALENEVFSKVVATKSRQIQSIDGSRYMARNINILLDIPGVSGVKTGFTDGAGQVLVTSRNLPNENADLIFVVMQSQDRFGDTEILLNYLNNNITFLSIRP
ncbi:MAG: D-alanyl-D-alanine carboxypeptidase [Candidatus Levybacteria bacterium]|nr:D-alanyl-D-alanine carboxypeptidase [Candidatus Levybacteria bacterium]